MPKMIQIRNVPDEVHREAKARAARARMSLSAYLLREIEHAMSQPEIEELLARIAAREPVELSESSVELIRAGRGEVGVPESREPESSVEAVRAGRGHA